MELVPNPFAKAVTLSPPSFPVCSLMRTDRDRYVYRVGDVAPSIAQLLLSRVEAHVLEAGVKPKQITQSALHLFQLQEPDPVSITDPHQGATISACIIKSIYEVAPIAGDIKVEYFKQLVYGKARTYIAQLMGNTEPASEEFTLPRICAIFDPYIFKAEKQLYLSCDALPPDIKNLFKLVCESSDHANRDPLILLVKHLMDGPEIKVKELPKPQLLIAALENMPFIKAVYAGDLASGKFIMGNVSLGNLQRRPEAEQQEHFQKYIDSFVTKILPQGLMVYASLVEQERRPSLEHVATFEIWPDIVEKRFIELFGTSVTRYRANAAREQNKVCLSVMNTVPTVVHEIGHQVEFYLPLTHWLTLHRLLRSRQKSDKLIDIYGNGKELAIDTSMPAFTAVSKSSGMYVARLYSSGDTEIVSMSLEYFSQPDKAKILINTDPLLAAIILRAVRPQDVQAHIPSELLALLPQI